MLILKFQKSLGVAFSFISIFLLANIVEASNLDKNEQALKIIADFADRLCQTVPLEGKTENIELSGKAKAELNKLLEKIADIGIEGAAKYQETKYQGVLQQDLANIIKNGIDCRLEVWNDLNDKLLLPESENVKAITVNAWYTPDPIERGKAINIFVKLLDNDDNPVSDAIVKLTPITGTFTWAGADVKPIEGQTNKAGIFSTKYQTVVLTSLIGTPPPSNSQTGKLSILARKPGYKEGRIELEIVSH